MKEKKSIEIEDIKASIRKVEAIAQKEWKIKGMKRKPIPLTEEQISEIAQQMYQNRHF